MKKQILVLVLAIFLIISLVVVSAADVNLCLTANGGTPSFNILVSNSVAGWYQNPSLVNDDLTTTQVGYVASSGRCDSAYGHFEAIVNFAQPSTISKVEFLKSFSATNYQYSFTETIFLWYSSQWNQVYTYTYGWGSHGSSTPISVTGSWTGVGAVKVKVEGNGNTCGYPSNPGHANAYLYEVRAFGISTPLPPSFQDSGLRIYNGTSILKIVANSTSELKMYNGTSIVGIALINPSEFSQPYDSKVRIMTPSGVKGLRKF